MATYKTNTAMNEQGKRLLAAQSAGTYKPPTSTSAATYRPSTPSNSATTLGVGGTRPTQTPKYISSTGMGNQKTGGSSTSSYNWSNYTPTTTETEQPDWIPEDNPEWWSENPEEGVINDYTDSQSKQLLASLRAAYDQNRNNLYAQKPMIQQEAAGMRNSADTSYFQSLPELYKAMESGGQRGGENITGMVGLNTVRGQGRNNADLYESNNLRNIENAITNLGSQQSQAEAEGLMGIGSDTFAAKLQSMRDAVTQANTLRQQEKADFTNSIGAYADDYMKQYNNVKNDGDPNNDYQLAYLLQEHYKKIANQEAAAQEANQNAESNALAWARINKSGSSDGGAELTYDQALVKYQQGDRSSAVLRVLGIQ